MNYDHTAFKKAVTRLSWFGLIYLTVFHSSLRFLTPFFNQLGLESDDGQNGLLSLILATFGILLFAFYSKGTLAQSLSKSRQKMTLKNFLLLTVCVIGVQFVLILVSPPLEALFNAFGYSLQASNAAGAVKGSNPLIFVYGAIIAPISEEIIFRGAMQASVAKYSRVFAIVFTAMIFALMHANFTQAIFAFFVGLIFGYIAMEYSVFWAIALHLMNNLVYSELIAPYIGVLATLLTTLFFIGLLMILFSHRKAIKSYRLEYSAQKGMYRIAYSSLPFILMVVVALIFAFLKVTPV